MRKSTIVIFNELNIKNNKNDKDNLKKTIVDFLKKKKKKSRVSVFNYLTLPKSFRPLLKSPYVSFPS